MKITDLKLRDDLPRYLNENGIALAHLTPELAPSWFIVKL